MSKFTTEIRYICETYAGYTEEQGYSKIDEILTKAAPKVFDFDFPIYEESHRLELEKKILLHYYRREIGAETIGLWKTWLMSRMRDIMPYYNEFYKTAAIDYQMSQDGSETETQTHDYNTSGNGTGWNMFSDTPQGSISDLDSGKYLTNATKTTNQSGGTDKGTMSIKREHATAAKDYARMIDEYRKNIVNIDLRIIHELKDLFINLWE